MSEWLTIEFQGAYIEFGTDVPDFADFIRANYVGRLSRPSETPIARITVMKRRDVGFEIENGTDTVTLRHVLPENVMPYVKDQIFSTFMRSRPDLIWLHAAAVARAGRAILFCGESGVGKSTLSITMCAEGWRLLSDDVAPISSASNVLPFFQGAVRRINTTPSAPFAGVHSLHRESVDFSLDAIEADSVPLSMIFFPEFWAQDGVHTKQMSTGEAAIELIRNTTNFVAHSGNVLEKLSNIALKVPAFRLQYNSGAAGVAAVRALLQQNESTVHK